jgi:CHAP domain
MRFMWSSGAGSGGGAGRMHRPVAGLAVAGLLSLSVVSVGASAAYAGTEDFKAVFQDNDNVLAGYSSSGSSFTTTLGMMAGTSPSVAQLADGTYEAAFEANNDVLALSHLGGGTLGTTLGMDAGTSPAIAALPNGGWIAAFQDNAHQLYLYDSKGDKTNTNLGMDAGTDPALAVQPDGTYRVVFQDNDSVLAGYNSTGSNYTTTVGMAAGTSPAITALADGSYVVAVEANTHDFATVHLGTGYTVNTTTLGMDAGTSPAIASQADKSYKAVFQDNDNVLAGYNSTGSSYTTTVGMKAGTSPAIAALTDATYAVAVEANTDDFATIHLSTGYSVNTTTLGMDADTNPSLATPAPAAPPTIAASLASLANANVGKGAGTCSQSNSSLNSLGGTAFYTSCTGNGGSAEYWCADFAMWVWANVGINITGLTPAAGSFIADASENGSTVHTSGSYAPQVGDAVVYDYNGAGVADHVGLVTAVNSDGSITTDNGDFGGVSGDGEAHFAETSTVEQINVSSAQKYVGDTPSGIGMTISGYVTPSGLS